MKTRNSLIVFAIAAIGLAGCSLFGGGGTATEEPAPSCTPQACAPGETLQCPEGSECPQGCGMVCGAAPVGGVDPQALSPVEPVLSLASDVTEVQVGQNVTFTGHSIGLGQPRYTLTLTSDVAGSTPITYSVTAGETLPLQMSDDDPVFSLVSGTATEDTVTIVLLTKIGATVTATLGATGEATGPEGEFFQTGASAPEQVVVKISGSAAPGPVLVIEAPTGDVTVGETITVRLNNQSGTPYSLLTLAIANGDFTDEYRLTPGQPYVVQDTAFDALFEVPSVTEYTLSADYTLKAIRPGTVTLTGYGDGDSGRLATTETITLTVVESTTTTTGDDFLDRTVGQPGYDYLVQPGDTLASIGRKVGIEWPILAEVNGFTPPYLLYPGDTVSIPATRVYIVKEGDWLYQIGRDLGISWADLARVNGLVPPYTIYPQDVLRLP